MYALLSALERDLRDILVGTIAPLVPRDKLFPDAIRKKATDRLAKDDPSANPTDDLLIEYLDLGEEIQLLRAHDSKLDDTTRSYI
jgi:hypothetical protein